MSLSQKCHQSKQPNLSLIRLPEGLCVLKMFIPLDHSYGTWKVAGSDFVGDGGVYIRLSICLAIFSLLLAQRLVIYKVSEWVFLSTCLRNFARETAHSNLRIVANRHVHCLNSPEMLLNETKNAYHHLFFWFEYTYWHWLRKSNIYVNLWPNWTELILFGYFRTCDRTTDWMVYI